MLKLDRTKDFGTVSPPWMPDGCDRPAYYEQGGQLFDAHDVQIVKGKKQIVPAVASESDRSNPPGVVEPEPGVPTISVEALMAQAQTMPWPAFKKHARSILGETCPNGKAAMLEALNKALGDYQERQARKKGMSWGALNGQPPEATTSVPAVAADSSYVVGAVDLAAWGRGQQEYLFSQVRKAIKARFNRVCQGARERKDAVDFLVEQKVIPAHEARRDVQ